MQSRNRRLPRPLPVICWASAVALLLSGCGEKAGPTIAVTFTDSAPLADAAAADIVFAVTNTPANGVMLDLDADGQPDFFAYPSDCGASFPGNCGFPLSQAGEVDIGNLPLGFSYELEARVRNSAGTTLYSASTTFDNDGRSGVIPLTLAPETP